MQEQLPVNLVIHVLLRAFLTGYVTTTKKNAVDARLYRGGCVGEITMFGKLLNWMKIPIAKVPEEIAVCEFECGEHECLLHDWEHCERRLHTSDSQGRDQRQ